MGRSVYGDYSIMPFTRPTLQELSDRIEADFKSRIEGATTLLRRSILRVLSRVYAGAIHLTYGFLDFIKRQLFATTADAEHLDVIGTEVGKVRKAEINASGEATGTGTSGTVIPAGTELTSGSGTVYLIDDAVTVSLGSVNLPLTAEEGGDNGNEDADALLTFVSPVPGVNSTATVDSNAITGGLDEETDDEYRERILARKRRPPSAGAAFDYESWALEVPGVTRAFAIKQIHGPGTIGVAFLRDNDISIIPDEDEREEVRQHIISHIDPLTGENVGIPVTAEAGLFIPILTLQSLNYSIAIRPNDATIQALVRTNLTDLIIAEGGPGKTVFNSSVVAAIASAAGHIVHRVEFPGVDVASATNQVPVLGQVTFSDY